MSEKGVGAAKVVAEGQYKVEARIDYDFGGVLGLKTPDDYKLKLYGEFWPKDITDKMFPSFPFGGIDWTPLLEKNDGAAVFRRLREFINERLGTNALLGSLYHCTLIMCSKKDVVDIGEKGDGEIVVGGRIVISASGAIYERTPTFYGFGSCTRFVGRISPEDASALIAALAGRKELGDAKVPSDAHIASIKKMVLGEEPDFSIFFNKPNCPCSPEEPFKPYEPKKLPGLNFYFK